MTGLAREVIGFDLDGTNRPFTRIHVSGVVHGRTGTRLQGRQLSREFRQRPPLE